MSRDKLFVVVYLPVSQIFAALRWCRAADPIRRDHEYNGCGAHVFSCAEGTTPKRRHINECLAIARVRSHRVDRNSITSLNSPDISIVPAAAKYLRSRDLQ